MTATSAATFDRARRWHPVATAALLVAVAVLAYWPALNGGFVWDDDTLLTGSELVRATDGLYRFWFTTEPLDYWPMTNSSFWLEWRLWGLHSTGYHVTNLLLHVGSALLVWAILRRLSIPGARLAAFLFVLHPVNVESVAWIAQRKNTLSMFFFLLSILWYLKPGRWYWLSLAAFVLAMLSKGSVAILPGVLLLLVWWRSGSITRANLIRVSPFFVVAAALTVLNIWFQLHLATGAIRHVTLLQRALGAGAVVWFYLYKALLPTGLIFVYPQWQIRPDDIRWWLPLAAAVATTAALVWQRRRPVIRALLLVWLFFCLALLPVMGLTDVYYMTYSLVADHYQYIAILGIVSGAAAGLSWISSRIGRFGAGVAAGALLVLLGTATWRQSQQYTDAETLYRQTLTRNPSCWLIHNLLGVLLVDRSIDEAVSHFREAIRLKPDMVEAHNNLCHASAQAGRVNEALAACSEALRIDPNLPTAHSDLANLNALTRYREAIRLHPEQVTLRVAFAGALEDLGRIAEAEGQLREAIRLKPEDAEAHRHLGDLLQGDRRAEEAASEYSASLKYDPRSPEAHNNLGVVLARLGRPDEAVTHFKAALALQPDYADARNNLSKTLARGKAAKKP